MDFYELTIPIDSLTVLQKDSCFAATVYAMWLVYIYDLESCFGLWSANPLCSQVLSVLIHALYVPHSLIASEPSPDRWAVLTPWWEREGHWLVCTEVWIVLPREVAEALASQPREPCGGIESQSPARRPLLWPLGVFPPQSVKSRKCDRPCQGGGWDFPAR